MIENRDSFLKNIAQQLGRDSIRTVPAKKPVPVNDYATTRYADLGPVELEKLFIDAATNAMFAKVEVTDEANVAETVSRIAKSYGDSVLMTRDERLDKDGITQRLVGDFADAKIWDPENPDASINAADKAKVGVVYADYGIADCGFIVLLSKPGCGRSVSLLPENSIVVVRRSTLLPRVAQLAAKLHAKAKAGERMPGCINLIGGPSSTADIELIKVIGVHGPMNQIYVIVED